MLESDITVSIIIPNYNYSRYVGEAIESALMQSVPPLEVIVVDDGSTDDSVARIQKYPVKLIEQQHEGVITAKNKGAGISQGQFILFLDADDILRKDALKEYLTAYKDNKGAAFFYSDMNCFGTINGKYKSIKFNIKALRECNYIHNSSLIKREVFTEVNGYNHSMSKGFEDWDLYLSFAEREFKGVYVPKILLDYRQHDDSSRNQMDYETKNQLILLLYNRHKRICPFWYRYVKKLYYEAYYKNMDNDDNSIFSKTILFSVRQLFNIIRFVKGIITANLVSSDKKIEDPKRAKSVMHLK